MTNYLKLFAGFIFFRLKSNIITYSHTFPHYPQFCGLHFSFRQTEFHKKYENCQPTPLLWKITDYGIFAPLFSAKKAQPPTTPLAGFQTTLNSFSPTAQSVWSNYQVSIYDRLKKCRYLSVFQQQNINKTLYKKFSIFISAIILNIMEYIFKTFTDI